MRGCEIVVASIFPSGDLKQRKEKLEKKGKEKGKPNLICFSRATDA